MSLPRRIEHSSFFRSSVLFLFCFCLAVPAPLFSKTDFKNELRFAGEPIFFSSLAPDKPVALVILKSGDCPICGGLMKRLSKLKSQVAAAGGVVIAILWDGDSTGTFATQKTFQGAVLLLATKAFLLRYEFWDGRHRKPVPGVLFLDRCGEPSFAIEGRSPHRGQEWMILKTLRHLASQPSNCGMLL
jgi:hypothetical protein